MRVLIRAIAAGVAVTLGIAVVVIVSKKKIVLEKKKKKAERAG